MAQNNPQRFIVDREIEEPAKEGTLKRKLTDALRYKSHDFTLVDSGKQTITLTRDDLRKLISLL